MVETPQCRSAGHGATAVASNSPRLRSSSLNHRRFVALSPHHWRAIKIDHLALGALTDGMPARKNPHGISFRRMRATSNPEPVLSLRTRVPLVVEDTPTSPETGAAGHRP